MLSVLSCLTFVFLISVFQTNGTPAPGPLSQGRNLAQFGNMIHKTIGANPLDYNGYGCWCGFGGKGEPVDATDTCCQVHDRCYDAIIDNRQNIFSCSPYISTYSWDLDSVTGLPTCKDTPGSCTHSVCECDRVATECYKRNLDTFDKSLKCSK